MGKLSSKFSDKSAALKKIVSDGSTGPPWDSAWAADAKGCVLDLFAKDFGEWESLGTAHTRTIDFRLLGVLLKVVWGPGLGGLSAVRGWRQDRCWYSSAQDSRRFPGEKEAVSSGAGSGR